jgi:hypothetical protein
MKKMLLLAGLGIVAGGAVAVYFVSKNKPDTIAPAAQAPKQPEATIMPVKDKFIDRPIEATIGRPRPNIFETKEQRDQALQSIIAAEAPTQMRQPTPVLTSPTPVDVIKTPTPVLNKNPNVFAPLEPAPIKAVDLVFVPPMKAQPPSKYAPQPILTKDFSRPEPSLTKFNFGGDTSQIKGKFL